MLKVIEGRMVAPAVGSMVENEAGRIERLLPSEWDAAQFRYPNPIPGWEERHAFALNLKITGRSFQYRRNDWWVKVQLEFVGDGEPSAFSEGWLKVGWPGNLPRN